MGEVIQLSTSKRWKFVTTIPEEAGRILDSVVAFERILVVACEHGAWAWDLERKEWLKIGMPPVEKVEVIDDQRE